MWKDSETAKQYKSGIQYFNSMKFTENWPIYERFLAGDQWPEPTEKTKNMPRVVLNIIKYP